MPIMYKTNDSGLRVVHDPRLVIGIIEFEENEKDAFESLSS